jgi:hypothetical protein
VKVLFKALKTLDGTAVVVYEDVYESQPVYMLYHPLRNPYTMKKAIAAGILGKRVRLRQHSVAAQQTDAGDDRAIRVQHVIGHATVAQTSPSVISEQATYQTDGGAELDKCGCGACTADAADDPHRGDDEFPSCDDKPAETAEEGYSGACYNPCGGDERVAAVVDENSNGADCGGSRRHKR